MAGILDNYQLKCQKTKNMISIYIEKLDIQF